MKRTAILILIILIAGLILLGYYLYQGGKTLLADPYMVVSTDACLVIETTDIQSFFNSLTSGKGIFGEIEKIEEFRDFNAKLKFVSDELNKPAFAKILGEGTSVIAFFPSQSGKLIPMLSMTIPAVTGLRQLKEILRTAGIKDINEQKINGGNLIELPYTFNKRKDTLYMTVNSGLLISSSSGILVTDALSGTDNDQDIRSVPGFSGTMLAAGKNQDKIFVVFKNLSKVVPYLLSQAEIRLADKIVKLAGTASGDIHLSKEGLTLSGYVETSDTSDYLHQYKFRQPGSFSSYNILPSSTALFESVIHRSGYNLKKPDGSVPKDIYDLAVKIIPFLGDEITRAFLDLKEKPVNENLLVIYKLKNRDQCEQIFTSTMRSRVTTDYFRPDDQTTIPVYNTENKGLISLLLPGFAPGFEDFFYAFYDRYMITGNSYFTVSRLLYENILNRTLANDATFRDSEGMLPSLAGYYFYCIPSHITDYLARYLNNDIIEGIKANKSSVDKIQSTAYQFASINNMIYNNLSIRYKEEVMEESETEWETLLDTAAAIKPFFFTNHNTGAKEIFIQDMKNNAYLINAAGRVLWKVPIKERITGMVYMIDYYRNGKYQLLFSGKNHLHLLDRNGNYVERYPVRLRSPATNSLALFDYDNNRNYRLVIAGEDKMIYCYDRSGNVVKGWKPFRTSGYVYSEAGFFRVSGKDYIVVADESSIYFLDRSGSVRLKTKEAVARARGSCLRLVPGSAPSLICTSPDGTVQNIFFDGTVEKYSFRNFSFDHAFDFFDIDGDGFDEYVFIDKEKLYLYDHDRKEIFVRDFDSDQLGGPIYFNFSSRDRKIGVFDVVNKQIYLIDKSGKIMDGFPLRGASMFSIGKLSDKSDWNLIVGGTNRFLYNYKLETTQ